MVSFMWHISCCLITEGRGVSKSVSRELEIESIILDSRPERLDLPAHAPPTRSAQGQSIAKERSDPQTEAAPPAPSHALIRALAIVLVTAALAGLFVLSRHVWAQHAFDAVAFNDVLSVLKALDELDDGAVLDLTIRGPEVVPGLPGASVSEGSTLHVRYSRRGGRYVRGSHDQGSLTYRFYNGSLYASEKE
jgi:hypothetical protein